MLSFETFPNGVEWGLVTPKKDHIEIIDGKKFRVTTLPSDPRLQPARVKKRTLWNALTGEEKKAYLAGKRREAKKKRRKRRRK